jgi:hypothetical protein
VAQILGTAGQSLLIGRAAHIRRWVAGNLGLGPPPRPGKRPRTNLSSVAGSVRWAETTSSFHQRLTFERLMAGHVPPSARRDLKRPVYLRLEPAERFPRLTLRATAGDGIQLFGPLRDRRSAERAVQQVLRLFRLRPCDYVFEPDPALPLGLGCVYAQVRSCAAPCLVRVSEEEYRELARAAAAFLASPDSRTHDSGIPEWVQASGGRGLVVERGRGGVELYPVVAGAVVEEAAVTIAADAVALALQGQSWPEAPGRDDRPWLLAWLTTPKRRGVYLAAPPGSEPAALGPRVRELVGSE